MTQEVCTEGAPERHLQAGSPAIHAAAPPSAVQVPGTPSCVHFWKQVVHLCHQKISHSV